IRRTPTSTFFPYTTLFRSNTQDYLYFDIELSLNENNVLAIEIPTFKKDRDITFLDAAAKMIVVINAMAIDFVKAHYHIVSYTERSEEHTSELQSRENLVCR